jgi:hypothetical protein
MKNILFSILFVFGAAFTGCKPSGFKSRASARYKPGQVWQLKAAPNVPAGATVTVLKVEAHSDYGLIIHTSLSDLKLPGGVTYIQHIPFTEQALDKSGLTLVREGEKLPDFQGGYQEWHDAFAAKHAGVFTNTVGECLINLQKSPPPPSK